MAFLTIGGWLFVVALSVLAVRTAAQRTHQASTAALILGCLLACTLGFLGAIPSVLTVALAGPAALTVIGMVYRTPLERGEGEHTVPDYAGELRGAWQSIRSEVSDSWRAAKAARERARHARAQDDSPDIIRLDPRRERKAMPLPAAVPGEPMPAPPPPPTTGRPQMTTPPPPNGESAAPPLSGSGSVADIFTALQQTLLRARAEGMPGKHRAIKMFTEIHDYLGRVEESFARHMSEPDQGYSPPVWEPLTAMAAHSRASSRAAGESDSALAALARMSLGDVSVNPGVRAPHHSELNPVQ